MLPKAGERFGPYEILAHLGGGGMGVVFRAWDERLHREVAIKVLREEFRKPVMRQRFLLEARAASALAHPHICTVFDLGEQEGEPYLVMELLTGQTLKEKIAQRACTSEEIVRYGKEIVEALAAAHAKGVVHRDIKPGNIFVQATPNGESIKILDFGLAKVSMALRSGRDSRMLELTHEGATVGTLAYMSPEQARGEALDARTDLFSTGIVLYEMAARRTPFRGETTALAFEALLSRAPELISTWNASVPRELERIISKLLSKDRSSRYSDALAVQHALESLLARGNGEWLRKLPTPVVPLVRSSDPDLRARGRRAGRAKAASWQVEPSSSAEGDGSKESSQTEAAPLPVPKPKGEILRPRRLPKQESAPMEVQHASSEGTSSSNGTPGYRSGSSANSPSAVPQPGSASAQTDAARPPDVGSGAELLEPEGVQQSRAAKPLASNSGNTRSSSSASNHATSRRRRAQSAEPQGLAQRYNPQLNSFAAGKRWTPAQLVAGSRRRALLLTCVAALAVLLVILIHSGSARPISITPSDRLLLGPIDDQTASGFADSVSTGLEVSLSRRSHTTWLGHNAYRAGQHLASDAAPGALAVAQALHASFYTEGELTRDGAHLKLHLSLMRATTGKRVASLSETASGSDDLPAAIDKLAASLLRVCGEAWPPIDKTLEGQTGQLPRLPALAAYEEGSSRWMEGDLFGAVRSYKQAVQLEPGFTEAQLHLAWIYDGQGAETAAAEAALRTSSAASQQPRPLQRMARFARLALADQDFSGALQTARQLAAERPRQVEVLVVLARANRLSGHMTEALLAAQKALSADPYRVAAADEAASAMIGLNRFGDARALAEKMSRSGVVCQCGQQLLPPSNSPQESAELAAPMRDLRPAWQEAVRAEARGDLIGAKLVWRRVAEAAQSEPDFASAAPAAFATEALNEAIRGNCSESLQSAREASQYTFGHHAAYHLALAAATCGRLQSAEAQAALHRMQAGGHPNAQAQNVLLPLVRGAELLAEHHSAEAALALSVVPVSRDAPPLSLYLRGEALRAVDVHPGAEDTLRLAAQRQGYTALSGVPVADLAQRRLEQASAMQERPSPPGTHHGRVT